MTLQAKDWKKPRHKGKKRGRNLKICKEEQLRKKEESKKRLTAFKVSLKSIILGFYITFLKNFSVSGSFQRCQGEGNQERAMGCSRVPKLLEWSNGEGTK
jgi:hypothetical protein